MGMDFVALMKYRGPDDHVLRVIDWLEGGSPEAVQLVRRLMQEHGHNVNQEEMAVWVYHQRPELRDQTLDGRPSLPNRKVALHLPEDFFLTFRPDTIEVYHLLRWHFFLTVPSFQRAMLDACTCLMSLLEATDCIITSDFSPVVGASRQGQAFEAALLSAGKEDGEQPNLSDLCIETSNDYIMRLANLQDGQRMQYRDWAMDQPVPDGWERATTWDSKGYWRLRLGTTPQNSATKFSASPPQRHHHAVVRTMNETQWATSQDPQAMLESLLRHDNVSQRKVRLWTCACTRRIWPLLLIERTRRVVEVSERYIEGRARSQEIDDAVRGAGKVRKGNRRARDAASLTAQLCASNYSFPPGDVSEAVADAAAELANELSEIERAEHANLLREIFGPLPCRQVQVDRAWLAWNEGTVIKLAQAIYDERMLPSGHLDNGRLAILADALEDAGCSDADILAHCRQSGAHVRGCWVVDRLLGKE